LPSELPGATTADLKVTRVSFSSLLQQSQALLVGTNSEGCTQLVAVAVYTHAKTEGVWLCGLLCCSSAKWRHQT
jgi:hypothetical protein